MKDRFKAIILDMDGVVIDSEPLHEKAQHIIFDRFGLDVPASALDDVKGRTENDVFAHLLSEYATEPMEADVLIEAKHETYAGLIDEMEMVPDALAFIRSAADRYRLALTTSSVPEDQARAFDRFDLAGYFELVVTSADITRPKPDPEPYRITVDRLGLDAADCLVVEDSLHGIRSARGAGCTVAGLTTSFDGAALDGAGADLTVDTFAELARVLGLELDG